MVSGEGVALLAAGAGGGGGGSSPPRRTIGGGGEEEGETRAEARRLAGESVQGELAEIFISRLLLFRAR